MGTEHLSTGCYKDKFDSRDRELDHLLSFGSTDEVFDYDVEKDLGITLPTKNQASQRSCVGQAIAYYAQVLNVHDIRRSRKMMPSYTANEFEMSAKSIYSYIYIPSTGGAYIRDGILRYKKQGINLEKTVPTNNLTEEEVRDISWSNDWRAREARILRAKEARRVVAMTNIYTVARAIKQCKGIILGFEVQNNGTWRSLRPKPSVRPTDGHCMYAGRVRTLSSGKIEIGCKNSWGDDVGEDGWQWFGEEWFAGGHAFGGWAVIDKPNIFIRLLIDKDGKPRSYRLRQ